MIRSLRKVDFSHPTGHYIRKNSRPLEKILGAPLFATIMFLSSRRVEPILCDPERSLANFDLRSPKIKVTD